MRLLPLLLAVIVLLTGCSSESESSSTTSNSTSQTSKSNKLLVADQECTSDEFSGGSQWIDGQISAFARADEKGAYKYASESFRANVSLEDFITVIANQYPMLLDLRSHSIVRCAKEGSNFVFDLYLVANDGLKYAMRYNLSLINKQWGVDSASVVQYLN